MSREIACRPTAVLYACVDIIVDWIACSGKASCKIVLWRMRAKQGTYLSILLRGLNMLHKVLVCLPRLASSC